MAKKPTDTLKTTERYDADVVLGSAHGPTSGSDGSSGAVQSATLSETGGSPSSSPSTSEPASEPSSGPSLMSQAGEIVSDVVDVAKGVYELGKDTQQFTATVIHTTVATVGTITMDAEAAMQRIRADASALHTMLGNVAHYATLPVVEAEQLVASIAAHLGVVRKG